MNNEVDAERRLQALSDEIVGGASETWDARERARKALNKAGERISRAVRALKRFSRGDRIDDAFQGRGGGAAAKAAAAGRGKKPGALRAMVECACKSTVRVENNRSIRADINKEED